MFIELVDSLRCPVAHEESHLIASATRMVARHILDGELGCPACHARYPIRDGEALFTPDGASGSPGARAVNLASGGAADHEGAMRLAALLGLDGPGGFAILEGTAAGYAEPVAAIVGEVPLLLVNPAGDARAAPGISVLRSGHVLPIASSSARGVATGSTHAATLAEFSRLLRDGGRLVAPASATLPDGVAQLARDEREWVAEKRAEPAVVSIGRAPRM